MSLAWQVFLSLSEMLLCLGPSVPCGTIISGVITHARWLEKLLNYD